MIIQELKELEGLISQLKDRENRVPSHQKLAKVRVERLLSDLQNTCHRRLEEWAIEDQLNIENHPPQIFHLAE